MKHIIETQDLTVRFGAREAVASLSVRIGEGTVGLLGPNGAGKTSLLKTLLGFIRPAVGQAWVLGMNAVEQPEKVRLHAGYFPEGHVFIPGLSAVEAVALAGELGGLPRMVALERAHDVLRFSGLAEARYRRVEGYSTGMLQRTKLAMALVHDPDVIFLDEPTSGLDPTGRRQMLELIQHVSRRHGISVVLSTHLLHDVEAVCDTAVLLKGGRLVMHTGLGALRKRTWGVYEVRAREEVPGRLMRALEEKGVSVNERADGVLHIRLAEEDTRLLFETARGVAAEIRRLERFEPSLEEVFLAAVAASDT